MCKKKKVNTKLQYPALMRTVNKTFTFYYYVEEFPVE